MRGVSTVIVAVLLVAIGSVSAVAAYTWASPRISFSFDLSESDAVQRAFESCNDRIIETARTGSSSHCIIPTSRGELTAQSDGLYYTLSSSGRLCDQTSDWVSINAEKHVELLCNVQPGNATMFNLRWRYPKLVSIYAVTLEGNLTRDSDVTPVKFNTTSSFRTVSVFVYLVVTPGGGGQNIDLNRINITSENVTLGIRIY